MQWTGVRRPNQLTLTTEVEPVAAAVFHAATFAPSDLTSERTVEFNGKPGETLAVLDLGGGTVDVSVVRRVANGGPERSNQPRRGGFQVLATRGDPSFGGADIDQALLEHIGSLVASADPDADSGAALVKHIAKPGIAIRNLAGSLTALLFNVANLRITNQ